MSLTREQIVAAATAPDARTIDVPEWGGPVRIRAMSYDQREDFTRQAEALKDSPSPNAGLMTAFLRLVLASVVDGDGNRVFKPTDEALLRSFNFAGYRRVLVEVQKFNGMALASDAAGGEEDGPLAG